MFKRQVMGVETGSRGRHCILRLTESLRPSMYSRTPQVIELWM